jgi:hypothetical protein
VIFEELGLTERSSPRRHLLESESFRALLAGAPAPLARAA